MAKRKSEDALSGEALQDEVRVEASLRPRSFDEYVGQSAVVDKLRVYVQAARSRGESLDHCLFSGPPGLGKTSLAYIMATELGVGIHVTSGPAIERKGDLAGLLTSLNERDILFIDEVHRLNAAIEEYLYPAMEDFRLDITIDTGPAARAMKIDLPPFTLIGATTRAGLLTAPLRDRFGIVQRLEFYSAAELTRIVRRAAAITRCPSRTKRRLNAAPNPADAPVTRTVRLIGPGSTAAARSSRALRFRRSSHDGRAVSAGLEAASTGGDATPRRVRPRRPPARRARASRPGLSARSRMRTLGQRARTWRTIRATSSTAPAEASMSARRSLAASRCRPQKT